MAKELRNCKVCGKRFLFFGCPSLIRRGKGKYCSKKCFYAGKENVFITRNPRWGGGRYFDSNGYVLVLDHFHPHCNQDGYVREHRLVMEKHLGRFLTEIEEIHHINGDKKDNRLENLQLMSNRSEHITEEHRIGTYKDHLYRLNFMRR